MKKTTLFLVLMASLFCLPVLAQTYSYTYAYDAAGNRTKRSLIVLKSQVQTKNNTTDTAAVPYEDPMTERLGEQILKVYPNPTRGELKVELSGIESTKDFLLQIVDIRGRVLAERKTKDTSYQLDISQHPAGTYLLVLWIDGKRNEWKIIKQ